MVDVAKTFAATVRFRCGNCAGDANSLIALLNLGVESGATIRVMAEGPDAIEALAALHEAIDTGLGEAEEAAASALTPEAEPIAWEGPTLVGVAASPGMAVGPVWQYQRGKIVVAATARDPAAELTRLERAVASAKRELVELYEEVRLATRARADLAVRHEAERRACYQPAITSDGTRIEVVANIAAPEEAEKAVTAQGEGVGLLRTEFLFLGRDQVPTEDEQADAYGRMVRAQSHVSQRSASIRPSTRRRGSPASPPVG